MPIYGTHSKCGAKWVQHGNRTGHCGNCCNTFEGVHLFDAHSRTVKGRAVCTPPTEMKWRGQPLMLVDGTWRGVGPDRAVFDK